MLRNKPRLTYSGLTIILSNPSRFDNVNLLSGPGGVLLNNHCLRPEFNSMQCDIRLLEDKSPLIDGTKCLLLLGEHAMHAWLPETRQNTLNEIRGSVYYLNGLPCVASYFPQDAADMRAHEQTLNVNSKEYTVDEVRDDEGDSEDYDSVKKHGSTKRSNYAFWLRRDAERCKTILKVGVLNDGLEPFYKTFPDADEVIEVLRKPDGQFQYFDMETDREENNLQCFSFSFDGHTIYNVPVLDFNYSPAYSHTQYILKNLAYSLKRNTVVAHNGSTFDFFVLGSKYRMPVVKCYDTMVAHHRCWPDVEKSLGHMTSHLTWQRFHKDEDSEGYFTREQMMKRLAYCGKDVYTMYLGHQSIIKYARTIPGLQHSIDTAMSSIVPYLTTTIQGIKYDEQKLKDTQKENDRLMTQYIRIINILIGEEGMKQVRSAVKGKAKGFPGSNSQCVEYFHNLLGYAVVARSKDTGKPSLGKKAIFKLALKYENPVLRFVLLYRMIQKEYGTLKFMPWKDDNNKIIDWKKYYDYDKNKPNNQSAFS